MVKHRSPAYPAIDLKEAVSLIEKLYPAATKHPLGADVVADAWGYKAMASASPYISAVKQYGLLDEKKQGGDRMLQLSSSGKDIAMDPGGKSPERLAALKSAAVRPTTFDQMWEKWGKDVPPDGEIRRYLEREREFNPKYVSRVAINYRTSLEFAMLIGGNSEHIKKDTSSSLASSENAVKKPTVSDVEHLPPPVGSLVTWPANQGQFPDKVVSISDDGVWVFVESQDEGVLVSDLTIIEQPPQRVPLKAAVIKVPQKHQASSMIEETGPFISFPLSKGNHFELRLDRRISVKDFHRLKQLIDLSEDSLVDDDADDLDRNA